MVYGGRRLHPGPDDQVVGEHRRVPRQVRRGRGLTPTGALAVPVRHLQRIHVLTITVLSYQSQT
jgi:hypothetical protein